MTSINERQGAHLYTQKSKKCETFLYTKGQTLFKKQDNFCYVLYTKSQTMYVTQFFAKILNLAFINKKHAYVTFIYKKVRHFAKRNRICVTFLYTKSVQFGLSDFLLNFWNLRRGQGCLGYVECMHDCRIGTLSIKTSVFVQKREYLKIRLIVCICHARFGDRTTSLEFPR